MKNKIIIFILMLGLACCKENPVEVKNENSNPVIHSLLVFPEIIGSTDSVIIVCEASDPDDDTLVYDWVTDARLRIKGTNNPYLYHTLSNTHVFYPTAEFIHNTIDTLWIQCGVRDVRGGGDRKTILFIVKKD